MLVPNLTSSTAGFNPAAADFEVPLADLGSGAVDTTVLRGVGPATFTRATVAWTKLAGGLWTQVASGVARSSYLGADTAVGNYAGYLSEPSATNLCLHNRDLTNAAWVKVNVGSAKDAIGIDGVAASASRIADSSGVGGTALQTVAGAAVERTFAAFVIQGGAGTVEITQDGISWTDVTSQLNSSTFTRVSLTATVLNPVIGFRVVGVTNNVLIDECQLETGAIATTPITTGAASATRNADVLTYPFAGNADATIGTCYAEESLIGAPAGNAVVFGTGTGVTNALIRHAALTSAAINDSTTTVTKSGLADRSTAVRKTASAWGGITMSITGDGLAVASGVFDGVFAGIALGIGCSSNGSTGHMGGTIKNARIWLNKATDTQLQALTA